MSPHLPMQSAMGTLAPHRTHPATRYVLQSLCAGMSVTADWQGAIASWPGSLERILGRFADHMLGHFVFGTLIGFDDLPPAAHEWAAFLDGGPYPQSPAHARVGLLSPYGRVPATASFIPILRAEAFETALFLERAPRFSDELAAEVERDYPLFAAALRRTGTGAPELAAADVAGTLVVFDLD